MGRSERWQKCFMVYCIFSCIVVGIVGILAGLSGTGWGSGLISTATSMAYAMYITMACGGDFLLWLISLGVWLSRKQSTKLWKVLALGVMLLSAKFFNFAFFYILTEGAVYQTIP